MLALLAERTASIQSLYAELSMSFEGKERSVVADLAVHYQAPGNLRFTAYKHVLLSSQLVFDLVLTPERYFLAMDEGNGLKRREGAAADLGRLEPGFRALGALRQALFLPGLAAGTAPRVERSASFLRVRARAPAGGEVVWELDAPTLGVKRARLELAGDQPPVIVDYQSYREAAGTFLPEKFILTDPAAGVTVSGLLDDVEVNADLGPEAFNAW